MGASISAMSAASTEPMCALVLAGRRAPDETGIGTQRHKALEPVDGVPMLERVVASLRASGCVESIHVCSDDPALLDATPLLAELASAGVLRFAGSGASPAASVAGFLASGVVTGPVLATAADHALLTPEMVRHFVVTARAGEADFVVGLVEASLFRRRFPDARRTFIPLRGDAVSGANLFLFATPRAAEVARFWVRAESFRKRPWRMVSVFGPGLLLRFLAGRLDLDAALAHAGRVIGARLAAVRMPFAEAAIDVDTPADLVLANRLLAERRQSTPSPS
jgi:GTP:adenosylcobinamide-phosphate guanylyltransferase